MKPRINIHYYCIGLLLLMSQATIALPIDTALIAYDTPAGQELLADSAYKQSFFALSQYFETQQSEAYCGIATSVMVLNALGVARPIDPIYAPYPFFTQQNIFTPAVLKITQPSIVNYRGMHISEVVAVLNSFAGVQATSFATKTTTLNEFRTIALEALQSHNTFIIASYLRTPLHENNGAHFSPIAAYDKKTDRFLLLDVARYKYPPVWVSATDLRAAMSAPKSDPVPGFIVVSLKAS